MIISRTCTEIAPDEQRRIGVALAELRRHRAYVLLGEPGAGKSEAFTGEADATEGAYIPAREFIASAPKEAWRGKTLFIDGLDEVRAGSSGENTQLATIRKHLEALGRPSFRLSCREADWRGASDRDDLARTAPDGVIAVAHIEDLSDQDVLSLLQQNHGVANPQDFLNKAKDHRLDALLRNPQTLEMLAKAVQEKWPGSPAETYELACRKLVVEPNKRHRDALRNASFSADDLLDVAGHVCAVQLLSGIAGFSFDQDAADEQHPTLQSIGLSPSPVMNQALGSRLFDARGKEEQREPVHRRIAEFLGARYLAGQLKKGLPYGRLAALMTADGGIVSDLRGLHAWLAVHHAAERPRMIAADPLGIVLYGDLKSFGTTDKHRMLEALAWEAKRYPWFRSQDWESPPFGALASEDMAEDFRAILMNETRDEAHESLLDCALEAITHGEALPSLADALLVAVRDASHWPKNRKQALTAYVHVSRSAHGPLLTLLDDISSGRVEDTEDDLLGLLLRQLYPMHVPASRVLDYLHPRLRSNYFGTYKHFWGYEWLPKTPREDLPGLLDAFAARLRPAGNRHDDFDFNRMAGELLATGLEQAGDTASAEQLWNWLGIGKDEYDHSDLDKDATARIVDWLERRPQAYQALVRYALQHQISEADASRDFFRLDNRLHGAAMPRGVEKWCFAEAADISNAEIRGQLFSIGARSLLRHHDYTPRWVDELLAVRAQYANLQSEIDGWLQCEWSDWRKRHSERKFAQKKEKRGRIAEWSGFFRQHLPQIAAGTAQPKIMHDLAMVYFGRFYEAVGDDPIARLKAFFNNDAEITQAALSGLQKTLFRQDLPSVDEIATLQLKGRHHYIAEACLAGIESLNQGDDTAVLALPADVQSRLVAFRLGHDFGNTPSWYLTLVKQRATVVAEALITYVSPQLKGRHQHISGIHPLAHDEIYAEVARQSALPLLEAYPARGKKEGLGNLDSLLKAAIQYSERGALLRLIESRLALTSLDMAQRGQWLSAGLLLAPEKYESLLVKYIGRNQARALSISGFFESRPGKTKNSPDLSESAVVMLITALGPYLSPERPTDAHWVSPAMEAADFVRGLISRLGASPSAFAATALTALLADERMRAWHNALRHQQESQKIASREARFQHASAASVVRTLANAGPASAADLWALLVQHLRDLAHEDKHGNTTGYLRYWNVDSHNKPQEPRPENDCRDRLLELLKAKLLPNGVDAQPEGEYRENTRADIRASFGGINGFNVPIEIKRDRHGELWRALRDQLMAQYLSAPGADGHGIYLVFWFGGKGMPAAGDGGKPPRSAAELEMRLRSMLSQSESARIEVIVMDCSVGILHG